ncbi:shikimate kinase [Candidatus Poribacteria bacterium]|nr:shikimate kinase [Candidatus Poribacteria bacterium]
MTNNKSKKNIILVGFMGTGKTAVGTYLADMLGMTFVDTDDVIEQDSGMIINDIFSDMGEKYFRDLESAAIEKVSKLSKMVVATGGGAVIRYKNIEIMKSSGIIFRLNATPEVIFQRTSQFNHRPLLQVDDPISQIRDLLEKREEFYSKADHTIDTSLLTVEQVADKIAGIYGLNFSS